jgi:hypothetical protein
LSRRRIQHHLAPKVGGNQNPVLEAPILQFWQQGGPHMQMTDRVYNSTSIRKYGNLHCRNPMIERSRWSCLYLRHSVAATLGVNPTVMISNWSQYVEPLTLEARDQTFYLFLNVSLFVERVFSFSIGFTYPPSRNKVLESPS